MLGAFERATGVQNHSPDLSETPNRGGGSKYAKFVAERHVLSSCQAAVARQQLLYDREQQIRNLHQASACERDVEGRGGLRQRIEITA